MGLNQKDITEMNELTLHFKSNGRFWAFQVQLTWLLEVGGHRRYGGGNTSVLLITPKQLDSIAIQVQVSFYF